MGIIELGINGKQIDQIVPSDSIQLPNQIPQTENILTEDDNAIVIPASIPVPEKILTDGTLITSPIITPSSIPSVISGDKYYVHVQSVASDIWSIYHNMQKKPAIFIEDSLGEQVIAEIKYPTNNLARVYFGKPYVGTAYCN